MQWYHYLYLSIYAVLILLYALIKIKKLYSIRVPTKLVLAAMFLAAAVVAVVLNYSQAFLLTAVGLFFAALGDGLLLVDTKKGFSAGVISFGISNTVLIVAGLARFGFHWYFIPIVVACQTAHIVLQCKKLIDYGSSKVILNIYMPIVGCSGCIGISAVIAGTGGLAAILFGVGALAFFVSDILLGLHKFVLKRWYIDGLNSLFYFSGVMLIAASMFV